MGSLGGERGASREGGHAYVRAHAHATDLRRAHAQHLHRTPPAPGKPPKALAARGLREGHPHALVMGKIDRATLKRVYVIAGTPYVALAGNHETCPACGHHASHDGRGWWLAYTCLLDPTSRHGLHACGTPNTTIFPKSARAADTDRPTDTDRWGVFRSDTHGRGT